MRGGAFIFSAPHVIFIVNKAHLAFLSVQGLAADASSQREAAAAVRGGEKRVEAESELGGIRAEERRG